MGQVWMGTHANQSVPVAIKVIADELAATERFKLAFADEVRAVARLDHQSIVTVFDHGRIPAEVARGSRGQLVEGTPYFVMEYCNAG